MPTPTILLGRMRVREDLTVAEQADADGGRTLTLTGQESIPRLTAAAVARQREDILTLPGSFVPVSFQVKNYLDGFYEVDSASGTVEDWDDDLVVFRWSASLLRAGTEADTDIESRLSGSLTRVNDFTITGERTHAPAITHGGYWSDATVTSAVQRVGEDGTLKLYRGIGSTVNPRWSTTAAGYATGRVRFTDELGLERSGDGAWLQPTGWTLSNGLVRVQPLLSGGVLAIAAYTGGAWHVKNWDVLGSSTTFGVFDRCQLLHNQYEAVTVRMMKMLTTGRVYLDITLRRGHRFVEIYLQSEFSQTLKVVLASAEGGTAGSGMVVRTTLDADNNKYLIGSARSFTADAVNGGISKSSATALDAFVGVVAGSSPVTGDAAADLQKQYVGMPNELVQGVRR